MRLLVINWQDRTHPQAGGAEVHLHEIFGRIAQQGHHVTLLCCHYKGAKHYETLDGIRIVRVGARATFNYVVPLWWVLIGRKRGYDLVVDDINKLPFFTPMYVGVPKLAIVHHLFADTIFSEVGKAAGTYVQWFEQRIPQVYKNTPICVVSTSTKTECTELGLPEKSLHVIHNGIDHSQYPMRIADKATQPTAVYFGRLKRYKSVDHIIRAMSIVVDQLPNAQLRILGTGDQSESLKSLTRELGLQNNIHFSGYVTDTQKLESLSSAHVAVNSSVKEGWGITNLEANACGTPVISANVPGLRDSVLADRSGQLYPYGNVERLAELMLQVLSDATLRVRLSEGALEWAKKFSWDSSANQMLDLCRRIANS